MTERTPEQRALYKAMCAYTNRTGVRPDARGIKLAVDAYNREHKIATEEIDEDVELIEN